jgi:hypothetical protein
MAVLVQTIELGPRRALFIKIGQFIYWIDEAQQQIFLHNGEIRIKAVTIFHGRKSMLKQKHNNENVFEQE